MEQLHLAVEITRFGTSENEVLNSFCLGHDRRLSNNKKLGVSRVDGAKIHILGIMPISCNRTPIDAPKSSPMTAPYSLLGGLPFI